MRLPWRGGDAPPSSKSQEEPIVLWFRPNPAGGNPVAKLDDGTEVFLDPLGDPGVQVEKAWLCMVERRMGVAYAHVLRPVEVSQPTLVENEVPIKVAVTAATEEIRRLDAETGHAFEKVLARLSEAEARSDLLARRLDEIGAALEALQNPPPPPDPRSLAVQAFERTLRARGLQVGDADPASDKCLVHGCAAAPRAFHPVIRFDGDPEPTVVVADACEAHAANPRLVVRLQSFGSAQKDAGLKAMNRAGARLKLPRPKGLSSAHVQIDGPEPARRAWDASFA